MTPELQRLQPQRKLIHRQSIQNPTTTYIWQQFRAVRCEGTKLNKELRSRYYLQRFRSSKESPRKHWNVLNSLLGREPIQNALPVSTSELTTTCILSNKCSQSQILSYSCWSRTCQCTYCSPRSVRNRSLAAA